MKPRSQPPTAKSTMEAASAARPRMSVVSGRLTPQRRHELAVVLVRDLPGAMVELELLERLESAVTLLCQRDAPLLLTCERLQPVAPRLRVEEERPGDEEDACDGQQHPENDGEGHAWAGASRYRATRRRCSRASGHRAISAPPTNTNPANQMKLTSGFTSAFRWTEPPGLIWSAIRKRSPPFRQSCRMATSFDVSRSTG